MQYRLKPFLSLKSFNVFPNSLFIYFEHHEYIVLKLQFVRKYSFQK